MNLYVPPQQPSQPQSPFALAVKALQMAGHRVEPAPGMIPGLCHIDGGPELTMGQVIDAAWRMGLMTR